jgi:hypothetical protein
MQRILTAAIAATAMAALVSAAQAKNVCQWTGHDWACGDGNVVTAHYSEAQGPNMVITPTASPQLPPGQVLPNVYGTRAQ